MCDTTYDDGKIIKIKKNKIKKKLKWSKKIQKKSKSILLFYY